MKARRVSETIARRIQRAISNGKLEPGEKLPAERDLAKRLSVSRVSVREAYRSLAELGLLSVKRGAEGGAFIADVDHQPVTRSLSLMLRLGRTSHEELTEARVLLEPPIAGLHRRSAFVEHRRHRGTSARTAIAQALRSARLGSATRSWRRKAARPHS